VARAAKEYLLVHGAAHGAWCCEEALEVLKQVLEERGEWEA
jgi:hypothetical protein